MIIYLDRQPADSTAPTSPPWLDGWTPKPGAALCHLATEIGMLSGIGEPLFFTPPRAAVWSQVDDRWSALQVGPLDLAVLRRDQFVYDLVPVEDLSLRAWMAPKVLLADGTRSFRVRYGKDWLPALTESQIRMVNIAEAAREALAGEGVEMKIACQWAAELLCEAHHLSPATIAALELMDEPLALGVLSAATSQPLLRSVE